MVRPAACECASVKQATPARFLSRARIDSAFVSPPRASRSRLLAWDHSRNEFRVRVTGRVRVKVRVRQGLSHGETIAQTAQNPDRAEPTRLIQDLSSQLPMGIIRYGGCACFQ